MGEIAAGGKTVQQLQDHLSAVYANMVKGAVVTVIVKEIRSRPVYFIGGFGNPGAMQLTRDLTLLQAISVVGGVVPNADGEKGFLLRGNDKIPIDFTRLVQRGDLIRLQPNDILSVPRRFFTIGGPSGGAPTPAYGTTPAPGGQPRR
jgi:polysaccharide export outer membrane protein